MNKFWPFISFALLLSGCSIGKHSFSPGKKYTRQQVEKDYALYQNILEKYHPGLYWYTGKDSMDYFFSRGKQQLKDSMTEPEFRKVLAYVTSKINCGHTTVRSSKAWSKYSDTVKLRKLFPLSMKVWNDTMVTTINLNRKDTLLKRGTMITKINGKTTTAIIDTLFNYISTDGYNQTHKYQTLSNRGFFGSLYTLLFGLSDNYLVEYNDDAGEIKKTIIPVYTPPADTVRRGSKRPVSKAPPLTRRERKNQRLNSVRLLKIDSVQHTAMMDLSSFAGGYGLGRFFRNSFRVLKQNNISHLIVDVRGNGGGSVSNAINLSRYITDHRFKIADSLYATDKIRLYKKNIRNHLGNNLFITFLTRKRKDGYYHFGYFERHYFKPQTHNHFNGKTYILTGGNSFSATTLFISALIKQENVIVVGEETGGGALGNSAWLIPDVTLPETKVRFRLPLFRLVMDKTIPKNGKGIQPEVESKPTIEAIRRNADFKAEKAMELIENDKKSHQ